MTNSLAAMVLDIAVAPFAWTLFRLDLILQGHKENMATFIDCCTRVGAYLACLRKLAAAYSWAFRAFVIIGAVTSGDKLLQLGDCRPITSILPYRHGN